MKGEKRITSKENAEPEISPTFLEEVGAWVLEEFTVTQSSWESLYHVTHRLKGSSASELLHSC